MNTIEHVIKLKKEFIEKLEAVRQNAINKGMDVSFLDGQIQREQFDLIKLERN